MVDLREQIHRQVDRILNEKLSHDDNSTVELTLTIMEDTKIRGYTVEISSGGLESECEIDEDLNLRCPICNETISDKDAD